MDSPEKLATGRTKKHNTGCVGHLIFCNEKVDI